MKKKDISQAKRQNKIYKEWPKFEAVNIISTPESLHMILISKREDRYCSKCGMKMIKSLKSAVGYRVYPYAKYYAYSKYDKETGKEQFLLNYKCPKKIWFNNHDDVCVGQVIKI